MVMTILAMSGLGMFTPNFANAAASAGDLIKMEGNSSVYYFDGAKRFVFPNEATYFSWYSDFSGVITIPSAELQSYLLGGNVVMRPGTKLVKITTDPRVYAVEANGVLRHVQTEAQAVALYGSNWAARVTDVPDAFFTNYSIGTPLASGNVPAGSLVKNADSSSVYYYDGTNYRMISSEAAMTANRLSFSNVLTISNPITAGGTAITGMESALVKTSQGGTTVGIPVTSTGVMVSVSANTAVANNIVTGQALAEIGSFNFTASNDGVAIIRTIKLKRTGISSDNSLSNVYLFDGNTRLTDGASFSNGYVSFSNGSGLITVPAGSTKTITVKADVAGNSGNIGIAIETASDVASSASTVTGAFPLNSNVMSIMTPADALATVALATSTTATTMKAGNTNTIVWSATAAIANKAVDFKQIAFKQIGSINADDLQNLSLYVDGTKVATAQLVDNSLNFVFSPVRLNTGSHTIDLKADIIKGSSRTFSFSMQTAANSVFTDTNYNVNVAPTGAALTAAPSFTISTGTLSLSSDASFSTTEIIKTANNSTLSKFKLKAFGEDIKVNSLSTLLTVTNNIGLSATSTETVSDFAVFVDGVQVGSSQSITLASGTATYPKTFGTTNLFTVAAGHEAVVEIKGSLTLDTNTVLSTLKADITGLTAQGVTSYTTVSSVNANANQTLTVTSGSLGIAKNTSMQDQNVSKNTSKVKIGSFVLSAGSAEGVDVSNIRVNMAGTADYANNMSNLYISENMTPIAPASSNDFNVAFNVPVNSNKTIDVYADLGEITSGTTTQVTLGVTYRTSVTKTFANTNATPVSGQTLTIQTATLADPTIVTNEPVSKMIAGGSTAVIANYKFVATNGNATINELVFNVNAANAAISEVTVDGKTSLVVGSTVTFTGLSKGIVSGLQGTNLEVAAKYIPVTSSGQGGVATYATSSLTLTTIKYTANGVQSSKTGKSIKSNDMLVVASIPTVELASGNPVGMTAGYAAGANSELLRFKVANSNSANPINLDTITVTPVYSGTITSTSTQLVKVYDSSDLTTVLGSAAIGGTGGKVKITFTADSVITTEKTYVVRADTTGLTTAGNSIRLDLTSSDAAAALSTTGTGDWNWNDSTVATYANGYLLKNLPLQGNTMVK